MDKSRIKIFKTLCKVALNKGQPAFDQANEFLRRTEIINNLIYNPDFTIELPNNEFDITENSDLNPKKICYLK